ncbi:MAG: hypothetical protein KGP28_03465 [Bdellovibrionales bacterium]|nr:hypothetical protein [Bdellovibrionales bacterium]
MSTTRVRIQSFLYRLIASVLIAQSVFMPLARAQSIPGGPVNSEESFSTPNGMSGEDPSLPGSEAEALQDAEDLRNVIEGTSDRVRLRIDTYGFYDLIPDPDFAESRTVVSVAGLEAFTREDRHFELRFRNRKILESRFPVQALSRFGDFLVFIEDGAYLSSIPEADRAKVGVEKGIQYLSFIDLKQYSMMFGHSKSTPPIFTVPIAATAGTTSISGNGVELVLQGSDGNSVRVPKVILETWSRNIYGLAIDVTARILTPGSYATLGGVVEELEAYFKQAMDEAAMVEAPEQVAAAQEIRKQLVEKIKARKFSPETIKNDEVVRAGIEQTGKSLVLQRKVATRLRMIWQRLSFPAPIESAKTVKESLALTAYGLTHWNHAGASALKEGSLQLLDHKYAGIAIKFGVPVAAAAMLGAAYPVEFSQFAFQALNQGSIAIHGTIGFTRNLFDLGVDSVVETLKGLKPANFYQAYMADGKAPKFAVGVGAIFATGVAILATPLLVVNSWMLVKDLKKMGSFSVDAFIERQRKQLVSYLDVQAETQKKLSLRFGVEANTEFTSEDHEEVKRILAEVKERDRSLLRKVFDSARDRSLEIREKFLERVSKWRVFRKKTWDQDPTPVTASTEETSSVAPLLDSESIARSRIHSFGTALQSFLISYPSITEGFSALVRGWNGFTIFRAVFWSPTLWCIQTLYPNFTNVALGDGSSREVNVPSRANGGLDPTPIAMKRVFQFLTHSSNLQLIRAWEHKVLPIERALFQKAMEKGFGALAGEVRAQGADLKPLFQNVTSLTDKRFQELSFKQKVFFMRYVESLTARGLQKLLTETLAQNSNLEVLGDGLADLSMSELKERTLTLIDKVQMDEATAARLIEAEVQAGLALEDARKSVKGLNPEQLLDRLRLGALGVVDPKNTPSFKRVQVVLEMMQKPESMPRAVRATLSSLVMAKLLGVGMTLVALSSMTGSILQPFYPDAMFGPDSYFYMGKYPFVNGILLGLATSMMANSWVKLQQDASHADHFGEVPSGEDAKKGYLHWFYKQSFKNKENTFWGNQKTYWTIIWGNMKPAFVLILFTNMIGLGRFDLDGYISGYLLSFGVINSGFNMMMEQGSEFASYYPLKDFPERLRSHPSVQEYLAKKQQVYRFYFALLEKTFVDLQEMIIGNFQRMGGTLATVTYKNEALSRLMFGGFTPTELVYSGIEWLKEKTAGIPVIGDAAMTMGEACKRFLLPNYTSWDKVKGPGP